MREPGEHIQQKQSSPGDGQVLGRQQAQEQAGYQATGHGANGIRPYAWYVLGVLFIVLVFNNIDRNILSILAEDVKRDLKITDGQIGFLFGTAFSIFYALFGVIQARLADGWRRSWLLAIGLCLWSGMTALSGFATSYAHLAVARMGVAVGEASANPCAYSLIGDYFPKARRGLALAIYSAGIYLGSAIAYPVGGVIVSAWNRAYPNGGAPFGFSGWQVAFVAVGLPGLLLAAWVVSLREPLRGASDGGSSPVVRPGIWREVRGEIAAVLPPFTLLNMARHPGGLTRNVVLLVLIGAVAAALAAMTHDWMQWGIYAIGVYAVASWAQSLKHTDLTAWRFTWGAPAFVLLLAVVGYATALENAHGFWRAPYLFRTFYTDLDGPGNYIRAITAREEVAYISTISTIGAAAGVLFGGWLSDRWAQRGGEGRLRVIAFSIIPYAALLAIMYSATNQIIFIICTPLASFSGCIPWVTGLAAFQEMVVPRMRATAGAIALLSAVMIGAALGPYVTGKIGDVTGSLRFGMFGLIAILPIMVWILFMAMRRMADVEESLVNHAAAPSEISQ